MSNRASEQLFDLIKSLSGSEKRYFKLFSDRHHTKSIKLYSRLFEEIDKQGEYDEAALLQKFENEAITKHFSIAKNRLYHQILKSLDSYYSMQSIDSELYRYLHYSEILFEKALYGQCSRILNSAQKIALKYEKWPILIQILRRQKRLMELNNYEGTKKKGIEEIYASEQSTIKKIRTESDLWNNKSLLFHKLFRKGKSRSLKSIKKLESEVKYLDSLLLSSSASVEAYYLRNQTKSAFFFAVGDYKKSKSALLASAELLENNLPIIKDEPTLLTSVLANLAYVSAKLNQFDEVKKYLERSRSLPHRLKRKPSNHHAFKIFISTYTLELEICRLSGQVYRANDLLNETIVGLNKWESKLSEVMKASFYHSISSLYFLMGDFKKALSWNNELLNSISINKTEDQYLFAYMFHLVIHVELKNFDIILNTLERIERQLQNRKKTFRFERSFSNFMREVSRITDQANTRLAFEEFSNELTNLGDNKLEAQVFEYFDFLSWTISKLESRPFHAVLRESAPQKDIL